MDARESAAVDQIGPGLPDTSTMTDHEKFELYRQNALRHGGDKVERELAENRRVILGLRVPTKTHANNNLGLYDDRFVVLWREGESEYTAEFPGNTEPSAFYEDAGDGETSGQGRAIGVDADGDGRLDLGRIEPGAYFYKKGTSERLGDVLRPIEPVLVARDTNHDGVFDHKDSADPDATAAGFIFHAGLTDRTGSGGTQTLSPTEYAAFWAALGEQEEVLYVLVDLSA